MGKVLIFIVLAVVGIGGIFFLRKTNPEPKVPSQTTLPSTVPISFTASFEIYTNGTKRIFTDKRYHNVSADVYITLPNPGIVNVKKDGVTWANFFATLPMKLTKDCLTTGTGQVFCTGESKKLKFFINQEEDPDALDREISDQDKLRVIFE